MLKVAMTAERARWLSILLTIVAVTTASCSRPAASPPPAGGEAAATSASIPPTASPGTVSGRIPEVTPGVLAFVFLEAKSAAPSAAPSEPPVMDQVGQTFGPSVLFVRTGQPVDFRNSDDTLHNVHVTNEETREGAFNVAIPTGSAYTYTFKQDGFYHVGCDIHPAMSAEIVSTSTPYATTADPDGSYAFEEVPPGAYTLTIYAAGKKSERDITVTAPQSPGRPTPQ